MPLPWLIGAAVVGAVAVVAKAISNDDSSSDSDSDDAERREQEREAKRQRKHDRLTAQLANLKKDRLEESSELLAHSTRALEQFPKKKIELRETPFWLGLEPGAEALFAQSGEQSNNTVDLHTFEAALESEVLATSAYAQGMGSILDLADHSQGDFNLAERDEFLVNLQLVESLYGPFPFDSEELRNLTALREARSHIDSLQRLKQQLEQQG